MRILHVYKDFCPPVFGGMEQHIALMCRYQKAWAEVEALVCSQSRKTRVAARDGVRVTEVGEWGRFQGAPVSPRFPLHLRRDKADVLVVHMPNPTAEMGCLLARPRGAIVVRYHSDVVRQAAAMRVYRPFQMQFLRTAAMIIPTSEPYLRTSLTLQPFEEKCRVVPLGIVPEDFAHPDEGEVAALRQRYGQQFVFFCGKHRYYKGLEYLVRAAPGIDSQVIIAGDGPESPKLRQLAGELKAPVHFPGALTHAELVNHLHACAVFAFPAVERSEAFGMSIMEAHACGKPVVATWLGTGVEFINENGETGLNVPPRDSKHLAEVVNALLHDDARRERYGRQAKARIEREFTAEAVARREFELYQEAMA